MVVGQVGAGKSSLLAAILGEMVKVSGSVDWASDVSVAYVSQSPWLLNASLRENILFGSSYVWRKYKKVITACALQPDIDQLPSGDLTEIGEKGLTLSGGQKQRVALARALYSNADVVILDDPLASLDPHVGRQVFEEAIMKRMVRRKKTVVMVTHHVQYLSHAGQVLVMADGTVYYQGKVGDVKKFDPDLYESWRKAIKDARATEHSINTAAASLYRIDSGDHLMVERKHSSGSNMGHDPLVRPPSVQSQLSVPGLPINARKMSQMSHMSVMTEASNEELAEQEDEETKDETDGVGEKGQMVKQEHKETGAVAFSVYLRYIRACSVPLCIISIILQIIYHSILVFSNFWLAQWSNYSDAAARRKSQPSPHPVNLVHYNISTNGSQSFIVDNQTSSQGVPFDNTHYMEVYASLSCASVIAAFLATFIVLISGTYGGKVLYINMLRNVVHLPMRFFDTNPSGRILNRFSADITAIDQRLSSFIENLLRCVFYCLSAIVINAVVTPWFLLAAVPLAICYYLLQRFFRSTSRELQRLDSVTKSPIFSHFSESLAGLQTIRAFRAEKEFWRKAMHSIDTNITPFLFLQTINRWLGVRLDYMSCLLVFASAVASLSAGVTGNVEPAFIGLCITYALMISGQLNWIVRISAEVEMAMNSVERVLEYTDEPCEVQKHNRKEEKKESDYDESWPSRGMVEFHEVSLAYAEDLDPVLNNASFVIDPGEKIGVCGRTGSGKTSTVLSLFRVLNIVNGEIRIDNTDITRISLHHLRSRLAIIPQDPVLFSGTIRFNLDPEGILSDDRLWAALEAVQMKEFVQTLAEKLEAEVTEGGGNFSLGQRQLLCMARAIARNSRIVILDEATASIDHGTDNKLQEIVHGPEFEGRTVITIAHRISTIKQYDRVMVLDNGFLLEFASPNELLADPNSLFYSLANAAEPSEALELDYVTEDMLSEPQMKDTIIKYNTGRHHLLQNVRCSIYCATGEQPFSSTGTQYEMLNQPKSSQTSQLSFRMS
ncbi:hypothetical protein BaRGS_00009701 [Batillaria attramentaria]|uniref:Uncharacterized protein n=1 Tax=Batillaria attramentaria TaxID=370345 RepID=A0ABD0LI33_9CAEN